MVLMKKDGVYKYVPDVHIEEFRKNGYVVDGEEAPKKDAPKARAGKRTAQETKTKDE